MITRDEAWQLLTEYNQDHFHRRHAVTVEGVMRYFAKELGYGDEEEFWGIVGLLHDLDFEQYPEQHCIKEQEIMRERGLDERLIDATASHGWMLTVDIKPEHEMEKVLYATDELTGLIGAVALMRPSKSVSDLELKSVKKKYKSKGFAAGCSREVIERGAELLGWSLDDLISRTILAMRSCEEQSSTRQWGNAHKNRTDCRKITAQVIPNGSISECAWTVFLTNQGSPLIHSMCPREFKYSRIQRVRSKNRVIPAGSLPGDFDAGSRNRLIKMPGIKG